MKLIKCLFCGKTTTLHSINAQKKINGKVVTVRNTPVYYCDSCDETFLSKEATDVFSYIRTRNLDEKSILYDFDDMIKRVY
ncbi:MAG: YgiT-type zinc finger protein [Bacillota bacterium]|nr:YgiT-type zinc finger protein [Bacillota bacterium]